MEIQGFWARNSLVPAGSILNRETWLGNSHIPEVNVDVLL